MWCSFKSDAYLSRCCEIKSHLPSSLLPAVWHPWWLRCKLECRYFPWEVTVQSPIERSEWDTGRKSHRGWGASLSSPHRCCWHLASLRTLWRPSLGWIFLWEAGHLSTDFYVCQTMTAIGRFNFYPVFMKEGETIRADGAGNSRVECCWPWAQSCPHLDIRGGRRCGQGTQVPAASTHTCSRALPPFLLLKVCQQLRKPKGSLFTFEIELG